MMTERVFSLIDLYCGAGGAARGLAEARYKGARFDITGVDINPQPRYPFTFVRSTVFALPNSYLDRFQAAWASPPCQFGTAMRHAPNGRPHANLIPDTVARLRSTRVPWVLENVESDHTRKFMGPSPTLLCGSMFGLGLAPADPEFVHYQLRRHRLLRASFTLDAPPPCSHTSPVIGIYGAHVRNRGAASGGRGTADFVGQDKPRLAALALGLEPGSMTMTEMSQCVPPAYGKWAGEQLLRELVDG